jgi:hypothetical protein
MAALGVYASITIIKAQQPYNSWVWNEVEEECGKNYSKGSISY